MIFLQNPDNKAFTPSEIYQEPSATDFESMKTKNQTSIIFL
jgi:hypothetical protein